MSRGSILQDEKECFLTKSTLNLHKHHIYEGNGRRALSEKYGCFVWLRADWHNMRSYGVHFNKDFDTYLKIICQQAFNKVYPGVSFKSVFGCSYLEEEE